jgi:NitT/TauT family transport system substrate-binding protein
MKATSCLVGLLLLAVGCAAPQARTGSAPAASADAPVPAASGTKLVIAEPVHSLGYLPLYVANRLGYLAEEGIDVDIVTLTGGSAHTNAVLTGQAWAFIGGPEHNAFAKAKGASIKAVVNVVNRGNNYFVARPGYTLDGDMMAFFKGKRIITAQVGGTPHSITLYMLKKVGLDPARDVTLLEMENSAMLPAMQKGMGDVVITSEPQLSQGIAAGLWSEPVYNVPREFGPYAYSTINVRTDSLTKDPATAERFVRAMVRGLRTVERDHEAAYGVARQEFPTTSESDMQAMFDRAYADELWRFDGDITRDAVTTALDVVTYANLLKEPVSYDDIIDMHFLSRAQ